MKILIFLSLVVAASAAPGSSSAAVAQFEALVKKEVDNLFKAADASGDGQFDKADISSLFTTYDANKDSKVTEKEFVSRFAGQEQSLAVVAKGLFLELDMDRNGYVTDSDLDLYFKKIDQNDDGRVEKSEFEKYFTELFTILFVLQARQTTPPPSG